MNFGECDCCGKNNRVLHRGEACGLEAFACAECRYGSLADDICDLEDEIETLLAAKPETGEQWAHICSLEAALAEARKAEIWKPANPLPEPLYIENTANLFR